MEVTVTVRDGLGRATVCAEVTEDWRIKSAVMLSGGRKIPIFSNELLARTKAAVLALYANEQPQLRPIIMDEIAPPPNLSRKPILSALLPKGR